MLKPWLIRTNLSWIKFALWDLERVFLGKYQTPSAKYTIREETVLIYTMRYFLFFLEKIMNKAMNAENKFNKINSFL